MNIAIGSDHGGFELKNILREYLKSLNHNVIDVGTDSKDACDYPDFAFKVAECVADNTANIGIMVDGAGIGSAMCANRVPGVLAATCNELYVTKNAREHNNANVMCLGSQVIGPGLAKKLVDTFIGTKFEGGRHQKRVDKITGYFPKGPCCGNSADDALISDIVVKVISVLKSGGFSADNVCVQAAAPVTERLITEDYIKRSCTAGQKLIVKNGTIVTALAMDMARSKNITVVFE